MRYIKTIAVLALVTLFAACSMFNELEKPAIPEQDLVMVNVSIGGNARTILPTINGGFSKLKLSAENLDPSSDKTAQDMVVSWGSVFSTYVAFPVPAGQWKITATALITVGGSDYAVVSGSADLQVDEWNDNSVTIALYVPEEGQGTFTYTVNFPTAASATITLAPLTESGIGTPLSAVNGATVTRNTPVTVNNVASGFYFLTIAATESGKTVTRNEVVHIYPHLTTEANYAFTKLDFDDNASLEIGGPLNVTVNGLKPNNIEIECYSEKGDYLERISVSGNDATWRMSFENLKGASSLYLIVYVNNFFEQGTLIPVPLENNNNIALSAAFTVNNAAPLAANEWVEGIIPSGLDDEVVNWYSITVTQGYTYYFWLNNSNEGDGTKNSWASIYFMYQNGDSATWGTGQAWYVPQSFTADRSGPVYIAARQQSQSWSAFDYAIAYSTNPNFHDPYTALTTEWQDGNLSDGKSTDIYSLNVQAGYTYTISWNDSYDGDGTKSADVYVSALYHGPNSGSQIFSEDSGYSTPQSFRAVLTGKVYIVVNSYYGGEGTYAIKYSVDYTQPTYISRDKWTEGDLGSGGEQWYSVTVWGGMNYFWMNNTNGDGTYDGDVEITYYFDQGNYVESSTNSWGGWYSPALTLNAQISGTVYFKVSGRGTYAILCNSNDFNVATVYAAPLTENQWESGHMYHDSNPWNDSVEWYSVDVVPGSDYYFWVNQDEGARAVVYGYNSSGNQLFNFTGWSMTWPYTHPTTSTSETIYIRVTPYTYDPTYTYDGPCDIAYNTTGRRLMPAFTIPLGRATIENNGDQKGWASGDVDNKWYNLNWDFVASARYLILKIQDTVNKDGFGGIQIIFQGNGNNWAWADTNITPGWTNYPTSSSDTTYIVVDLNTVVCTDGDGNEYPWSEFADPDAEAGKFFIGHYGYDGVGFAALGVVDAYLSNEDNRWSFVPFGATEVYAGDTHSFICNANSIADMNEAPPSVLSGTLTMLTTTVTLGNELIVNYNYGQTLTRYFRWSVFAYDEEDGETKTRNFYTTPDSDINTHSTFVPTKYTGTYTVTMFATGYQSIDADATATVNP